MSAATQVRVALVDCCDHHTLQSCLAADIDSALPMVRARTSLPSTRSGATEVVTRVVGHPVALAETVVA